MFYWWCTIRGSGRREGRKKKSANLNNDNISAENCCVLVNNWRVPTWKHALCFCSLCHGSMSSAAPPFSPLQKEQQGISRRSTAHKGLGSLDQGQPVRKPNYDSLEALMQCNLNGEKTAAAAERDQGLGKRGEELECWIPEMWMEALCPAVGTAGCAASHSACSYWGSSEKQASISHTRVLRLCLSPLLSLKCISHDKWPIDTAMTFYFFPQNIDQ